jgi:acyl-CoA synthetase (AMP-forming)/AMP-acid ligase II
MRNLDRPGLLYTDMIEHNAKIFRDKPAVVCGNDRLSWTEFHRRTNKVANALIALGVKKGDKVCLLMETSIAMFELLWGTIKAGAVTVPLNVMMAQDSLARMINNSDARHVFVDSTTRAQVEACKRELERVSADGLLTSGEVAAGWREADALIDVAPDSDPGVELQMDDSMNIIYTSGSTGVPKGIEHSHFARHLYSVGFGPGLKIDRYTVSICSTPLYANGTWITMLPTVYFGGTVILLSKFSADAFLSAVERERCTHCFMVPTQFIVLVESPAVDKYDSSSLKCLLSGGQAITSRTIEQLKEKFPAGGLYECYGMTEGFVTVALPEDRDIRGKHGSVGLPIFGGDIEIIDDQGRMLPRGEIGEIAGWSPGLMKGYYKDPARTADLIWIGPKGRTYLKSGDIGHMDEDGYIYIGGRIKDMIKSGGINVFAADIEDVFMQHPDVVEVAAIGIPHEKWVETPLLLAILRAGAAVKEEELMRWGNERLGKFQRVSRVEFRTEFPRATHDKVLKRALRDPYWAGYQK